MTDEHCKDCCCARSWRALQITAFTGMSIAEHIEELRATLVRVQTALGQTSPVLWKDMKTEVNRVLAYSTAQNEGGK